MVIRPHVSKELIDYLTTIYPDRVPDPLDDERMIWCKVGHVEVVRHLTMLYEEQIEHQLGSS